jgi:hypothetical protein
MKPLNSKERAKAFYKVTGLFVLCFALAMLLGFSTMNVNKMTDYASRKKLEGLKNDLIFQEKVFIPNIEDATKKLQDLPIYKEKKLNRDGIETSINVSLQEIKAGWAEWKVDTTSRQYSMYNNIVDIYFNLKSAYVDKFKLEEQLVAKEGVVLTGSGDLTRELKIRNGLEKENQSLKSEKDLLSANAARFQNQVDKLQNQLVKCRDSLRGCLDINKGYKQQINKLK